MNKNINDLKKLRQAYQVLRGIVQSVSIEDKTRKLLLQALFEIDVEIALRVVSIRQSDSELEATNIYR